MPPSTGLCRGRAGAPGARLQPVPGRVFLRATNADQGLASHGRRGSADPGTVLQSDRDGVVVACGSGALRLDELQLPGKRRATAQEFAGQTRSLRAEAGLNMANSGARTRAVAAEVVDAVVSGGQSLDAAIAERRNALLRRTARCCACCASAPAQSLATAVLDQSAAEPPAEETGQRDQRTARGGPVPALRHAHSRSRGRVANGRSCAPVASPEARGPVECLYAALRRENLAEQAVADEEARWNHPQWLIETLRKDWPDDCEAILEANNARAPMWLRVNSARQSAAEYLARLADEDIEAELLEGVPDAVRLDRALSR